MEILIDIPDNVYNDIKSGKNIITNISLNGTPLPKGHGKLVDVEQAKKFLYEEIELLHDDGLYDCFSRIIDDMYNELHTIIEADKESD